MTRDISDLVAEGLSPFEAMRESPLEDMTTPSEVVTWCERYDLKAAGNALLLQLRQEDGADVWAWPGCARTTDRTTWSDALHGGKRLVRDTTQKPWKNTLKAMGGGLRPDRVYTVAGRTKRGKTAWLLNVAEGAAASNLEAPVLYVSAELGASEVAARLLSLRSEDAWYSSILHGRFDIYDVQNELDALSADLPNFYAWAPTFENRTAADLTEAIAAVSARHEGKPVLVLMDYLQRFHGPDMGSDIRLANRQISGQIRSLSRPGELPDSCPSWWSSKTWPGAAVVVLSSIGRAAYAHFENVEKVKAGLSGDLEGSFKETGEIEYDSAVVAVLTSDPSDYQNTEKPNPVNGVLRIVGGRYRGAGLVDYFFDGPQGRWTERELGKGVLPAQYKANTRQRK